MPGQNITRTALIAKLRDLALRTADFGDRYQIHALIERLEAAPVPAGSDKA